MGYTHWLTAVPNALCQYASSHGKKSIIISADKPYDVQLYPQADALIAVYGCKGSSVDPTTAILGDVTAEKNAYGPNILAGVEVILGTFSPSGRLPLSVPIFDAAENTFTNSFAFDRGYGLSYRSTEVTTEQETTEQETTNAETLAPQPPIEETQTNGSDSTSQEQSTGREDVPSVKPRTLFVLIAVAFCCITVIVLIVLLGQKRSAR
jgi:hypothetical protein